MNEMPGARAASAGADRAGGRPVNRWAAGLLALGVLAAVAGARPAGAQDLGAAYDPASPIEITADMLEVFQLDQMAVFSGNVDAVQGQFILSADLVRVHYRGPDDEDEEQVAAAPAPGPAGPVRRIEAEGNVFLSSPEETAQGRQGVYNVENGEVTLVGDVVLTRGANVIRGENLVVDLPTGRARVTGALAGADVPPEQRVRAVFVPAGAGGS